MPLITLVVTLVVVGLILRLINNSQQVSHRLWRWTPQGSAVPACILVVMRGRSARQAPEHTKHSAVGQDVIHHRHLHSRCTEACGGTGSWLNDGCLKGHELAGGDHILELAAPHGPL